MKPNTFQLAIHHKSRSALVAIFVAASVGSRFAMATLPNVKLVSFFAAMGGIIGGPLAGFSVGFLSMLVSDVSFFGAGFWTLVTSSCMGLVGFLSGLLWFGRFKMIPSRLEFGVLGYLITLIYDVLTSVLSIPVMMHLLYGAPATTFLAIFSVILGLFLPMGGFMWPAGPAHELSTALLLALTAPAIIKRLGPKEGHLCG